MKSKQPRVQVFFKTPVACVGSAKLGAWLLTHAEATETSIRIALEVYRVVPSSGFVHVHIRIRLRDVVSCEEAAVELRERFNTKPWLGLRSHMVEDGGGRLQWFEARAHLAIDDFTVPTTSP